MTTLIDYDHEALLGLLPHRPPILMIDRLTVAPDGVSAVAHKLIGSDEPCFRDTEQTDATAYPHALVVESLGQAAAALWLARSGGGDGGTLYFAKAEGVTFFGDVHPGDRLVHEVHFDRDIGSTAFMSGRTLCDGRVIATVDAIIAASR